MLLILAVDPRSPKDVPTIRSIGCAAGLQKVKKWNVADILAKAANLAINVNTGWELTAAGIKRVQSTLEDSDLNFVVSNTSQSLRAQLGQINDPDSFAFVDEAIQCFEMNQYRAAVVLSWVGAISVLQHRIFTTRLTDFNSEALRRDHKWKLAKSADDLGRMKEHEFLNVLETLGVLCKPVKQTLQNHCLQLRNSCGHPNALKIAENSVAAHIEKLILNVFSVL